MSPPESTGDDPPDLRLVPPALAAWAAALFALGLPGRLTLGCAAAGVVGAGLLLLWHPGRARLVAAAVLVAASAAAASAALRVEAVAAGPVVSLAAERARVSADLVVTSDPDRSPARVGGDRLLGERFTLRARLEVVRAGGSATDVRTPVLVLASDESWARLVPGQRVRARGRLTPPRHEGELAAVLQTTGEPEPVEGPPPVQRIAERLRSGLRASVSGLPPEIGGLVPGLVVGDTTGLVAEVEDDFRTAGLSHLVAVSGANVAIVLGGVLLAARYAGVRGAWLPVSGALAVTGFVVLARPQPSVLRAAVMGLIAVLALATGRRRRALPALCATVLLLVLSDPWLARAFGFSLSVLATAGLLVLAPGWRRALARRLPVPVADALAVPAAAQAACAPVLVLLDPRVSLVAVPANLLVAPAVAPATLLGVLAAVLAPVAPGPAGVVGTLAGVPAWWIVTVARHAADVPAATVPWPGGWPGAAALVIVLLAARALLPRLLRGRHAVVVGAVVAAGLAVAALPRPGWPPGGWLLVACDVGQGDALVLAVEPGTAVVVDVGPDPRAVDRCLRDLHVRRVPLVVLTHLHADHVEGLPGVLRGRSVGEIQIGPLDEPAAEAERVAHWAASASVPVTRAAVGESRRVGDLTWEVVWPSRVIEGEGSVPNNASVVLLVQAADTRLLLAGDVEPAAQRALLPALEGPVDVLKVPHHGSAYQAPDFLDAVDPRVGLISVGEDNGYGHPAPSTLAALSASGATVLRTDQDGDVAVAVRDGRLTVATQR